MRFLRPVIATLLALTLVGVASAAKAPDFIFKTDSGPLALQKLRGKVVYLDYWASWCVPCRQSFPWMNELHARYHDKGLVVIAVNVDTETGEAQRFLAQFPANFIVAYDAEGATAQAMNLKGMPTSFLIDRNGEVVSGHLGFREADKTKIEREIQALLGTGTSS